MIQKRFRIEEMHCVGCTIAVEGAVEDLPGVKSAKANYAEQIAVVEFDEQQVTEQDILAAIERAGYEAHPVGA